MKRHLQACGTAYRGCSPDCEFQEYHSDERIIERNHMKQITYDFDWMSIAGALVGFMKQTGDLEDGFWEININTECVTIPLPAPVVGARSEILPGHVIRMTGLRFRKVPQLGFMAVKVENGLITEVGLGSNTNQHGHDESSEGPGTYSRPTPASYTAPTNAGF